MTTITVDVTGNQEEYYMRHEGPACPEGRRSSGRNEDFRRLLPRFSPCPPPLPTFVFFSSFFFFFDRSLANLCNFEITAPTVSREIATPPPSPEKKKENKITKG